MPDTNFHQLLVFHNVAQSGSFTKAARELNITQPAVSIQVKELERNLDTLLVNRVRRGAFLTDAGEVVYGYTKRIFSLADEMRLAVQDLEAPSLLSCCLSTLDPAEVGGAGSDTPEPVGT